MVSFIWSLIARFVALFHRGSLARRQSRVLHGRPRRPSPRLRKKRARSILMRRRARKVPRRNPLQSIRIGHRA